MLDRLFGPCKDTLRRFRSLVILGAGMLTTLVLKELGLRQIAASSEAPAQARNHDKSNRIDKVYKGDKGNKGALSLLGNPKIKVIAGEREALKALSAQFPDIEPIHHPLDDEYFIREENIGNTDIVLCLTAEQSINILTALLAQAAGTRRTLALITNDLYSSLFHSLNLNIAVNEKIVMSGAILDRVRKAKIRRLYSFPHNEYELIEIEISDSFRHIGNEIRTMDLPKGFLIAFVIHEGKTYVPTGTTRIYKNDLVGIIIKKEEIARLEGIFGA